MSPEQLGACTRKKLAAMAKRRRISGWHEMRKHELVDALLAAGRARQARSCRRSLAANGRNGTPGGAVKDQLFVRVHDPYWLEVSWELSRTIIERAEAALGIEWHRAVPVIRVFDVTGDGAAAASETWLRDIEIHGEADHWYVPVDDPPRAYKLQIGYSAPSGKFFVLARSQKVRTPKPGTRSNGSVGNGTARTKRRRVPDDSSSFHVKEVMDARPVAIVNLPANGSAAKSKNGRRATTDCDFQLDAELIVFGSTHPQAELSLLGEPIPLGEDGSFSVRFNLPNGRQVLPVVSVTPDGSVAKTIVLALDRNTKTMEPRLLDELLL